MSTKEATRLTIHFDIPDILADKGYKVFDIKELLIKSIENSSDQVLKQALNGKYITLPISESSNNEDDDWQSLGYPADPIVIISDSH